LDSFVDVLARRIASFDRRAIAAAKNLINQVSLPSADRLLDALNSFQTALMWPETQQRVQALLKRGLQRDSDFEKRWPALLGTTPRDVVIAWDAQPRRAGKLNARVPPVDNPDQSRLHLRQREGVIRSTLLNVRVSAAWSQNPASCAISASCFFESVRSVFGAFDAQANQVLMNRSAKACAKAPGKMALRQRACTGHLLDGNVSLKLCTQHLRGP